MRVLASLALGAGLCFVQSSFAQSKVTSVEGIDEYRLDNGLQVLLFPDKTKPTVTVNVTYLVGSRHEGAGETGMAHLLEHMVFKGTKTRGDVKIELANHGAEFNGSTSFDRTNYFETMQASDANLRFGLEMEADRMINSKIAKSDLDSEMTVVRSEFEMGENSPQRVLEERVMSTAYLWHSYGRSPIGSRSDIEHVPIENLQAFYHKYYQPDNAVLVVAGNFDEPKTLGWIKETFGAIPKPTRALTHPWTEEPTQDGEREVALRRVGDTQSIMVAYHIPSAAHPDTAALEVLEEMLTAPPAGRLYKALVESKKAISAGGDTNTLHDAGTIMFNAQVRKDGSLDDVEKTLLGVVDGLAKEPPSKEEVDRAITRIMKNLDLAFNNSQSVGLLLSESASAGDWRLLFLDRDRMRDVKPEDIARVAKTYLKSSNRTIGRFIPTAAPARSEIPPTPDLAAALKNYKGAAAVEAGEAFDATPANIDARTVRVTLPNGMKLALLPKKTRGATVNATLAMHYGDEKSLFGKEITAQLTAAMLTRGTAKHTRQQLNDELDKKKIQMGANATAMTGATLSISTVRAGFLDALKLAAEVLREPAFPESEFDPLRQSTIGRIEGQRSEPQSLVVNSLNRHLSSYPPGDPRTIQTFDESISDLKKLTVADLKKFHSDFYGADHAELAIVGDFDTAEVQKLATELFGNWKSASPYTRVSRTYKKLEIVNKALETPDKANAVFEAGMTLEMTESDPDYPALLFAETMIGGSPRSRLWMRIREKEGLSYAVQSAFVASPVDRFGQFLTIAICNPQNIVKLESSFKDELQKIVKDGFPDDEVATAKAAFLQQRQVDRADDRALVRQLQRNAQYGWTMSRDADLEKKISALSASDVSAAVKRHIDPPSMSIFKGGDFKKAGVTP
ncbi:MAG: insulinase family protein [Acidobacteriia bacterium]|nr:insulinase family protein [Terriglobia bacterium]